MFDILIPVAIPHQVGFRGPSPRGNIRRNGEVGFEFGKWPASFHSTSDGARYFIVRAGVTRDEFESVWPEMFRKIAVGAAVLDLSLRPVSGEVIVSNSGRVADLASINLFPSGEMPSVKFEDDDNFGLVAPPEVLTAAMGDDRNISAPLEALRIFSDVDFETTSSSRFILLSTILELMADRRERDASALKLIDQWRTEATKLGRHDLAQAVRLMRQESIGSAISRMVQDAAVQNGLAEEQQREFRTLANEAYRKRSALLHQGTAITTEELASLRKVVRLILVGETKGTAFTFIGNRLWASA